MTNGECGRADFSTYCSFGSQHSTSCSPHWPASPHTQEINWTRMLCSKLIHPDVHFWSFPVGDVVWPAGQNMLPSGAGGTDISLFLLGCWSGQRRTLFLRVHWRTQADKWWPSMSVICCRLLKLQVNISMGRRKRCTENISEVVMAGGGCVLSYQKYIKLS